MNGTAPRWRSILFWFIAAALLLYRPIFVSGVPFAAFAWAGYDDGLFLRQAIDLRSGNWLGDYNFTTLCKGPFYAMFAASVRTLLVPLPIFEQAFYSLIALVAAWSVRPAIRNRWLLLAGLALLILNPYSWGPVPARLTRDPLAGQLALLCFAAAVGLLLRRDRRISEVLPWAMLVGVAGAACWMTREEGIWIVGPTIALLFVGAAIAFREKRRARACLIIALPLIVGIAPVLSICEQNRRQYGVFNIVDLKTREFEDAYGALLRVGQAYYRHHVPVPRHARDAMYEVSPTFRELQPLLEGEFARRWMLHRPMPDPADIQGGWFIWAFREAAQQASGRTDVPPLAFYRRLADEVNAACDAGLIPSGGRRSGLTTPLNSKDIPHLLRAFAGNVRSLALWPTYRPERFGWDDSSPGALLARDLVRTPLTGPQHQHMVEGWACAPDGPVILALVEANGDRGKFKPQWLESPDVLEHLRSTGRDWTAAAVCRFSHFGTRDSTHLLVYRGDRELARLPLEGGDRMVINDEVAACVDSFSSEAQPVLSWGKRLLTQVTGDAVCYLATPLAALTVLWFAVGTWTIRRSFLWLCITGALAGAVMLRAGLLAYIDATTYEVFGQRYTEPTYTALAFLFYLSVCALWRHFLVDRAASRPSLPQPVGAVK